MIPIHDFEQERKDVIPFKYIPLNQRADYDTTKAHRHKYYEIFLFAKGGGYHEIDFETHPIKDCSIHFVSPGQVHKVRREPDSYGSILLFSNEFYHFGSQTNMPLFEFSFLNTHIEGSPILEPESEQFKELLALSEKMGMEKAGNSASAKELVRTYLHIFLLKCMESQQKNMVEKPTETQTLFLQFKHLLEQEFRTQHLPSSYAKTLNITGKKLNEICKYHTGLTSNNFIKERLVLEAKRQLIHSNYSVKELAYQLGFEDPAYFNRFFKKHAFSSATAFRKANNESNAVIA